MKNYFYPVIAATTLMMAASCAQDEELIAGRNGDVVSFTINTGEVATRLAGEGLLIDEVHYEVWDKNTGKLVISTIESSGAMTTARAEGVAGGRAEVSMSLVKGVPYDITFWAHSKNYTAFDISEGLDNIKLKEGIMANNEGYDAFFKTVEDYKVKTGSTTVKLTRPFAQVNIGTTPEDWQRAIALGVEIDKSTVTVTGIHNEFDARKAVASGETTVEYALNDLIDEEFTVKTADGAENQYQYLAMNYMLADPDKTLHNLDVTFKDGEQEINSLSVTNMPIRRNWRTNIVGRVLTSDEDFEIIIVPGFDGDFNTMEQLQEVLVNGGKFTLVSDFTLTESITIPAGVEVEIDLGMNTLTMNATADVAGKLTISNGEVEVDMPNVGSIAFETIGDAGTVEFKDVTMNVANGNSAVAIDCSNGSNSNAKAVINIDNSIMTAEGNGHIIHEPHCGKYVEINVTNGSEVTGNQAVLLSNVEEVVIKIDETSSMKDIHAEKCHVSLVSAANDNQEIIGAESVTDYTPEEYQFKKTLENGGEITLTSDLTLSEELVIAEGSAAEIDLGGHTLTVESENIVKGTLKISNGSVITNLSGRDIAFEAIGSESLVELENVTMTVTGNNNAIAIESDQTNPNAEAIVRLSNTKINVVGTNGHAIFVTHFVKNLQIDVTNGSSITGNQAIFIEKAENAVVNIDGTSSVANIHALYGTVTVDCDNASGKPALNGNANFVEK